MHKNGVVYLNSSSTTCMLQKICPECYQFRRPQACRKAENPVQFYLLKHRKEWGKGDFTPLGFYFGHPKAPWSGALSLDPDGGSTQTAIIGSCFHARHVAPKPLNQTPPMITSPPSLFPSTYLIPFHSFPLCCKDLDHNRREKQGINIYICVVECHTS